MKTVLCFGDSNTWGYEPGTGRRHGHDVRWPGVLRRKLGTDYHIVEEGLNGRTTVLDDPTRFAKNGMTYFRPCLDSHAPIDLLILMLGTNDMKHRFGLSAFDIAAGIGMLLSIVPQLGCGPDGAMPKLLIMAPPHLGPFSVLAELFAGAEPKSRAYADQLRLFAQQYGASFFDTSEVVAVSSVDGVHFDAENHRKLGERVAELVLHILA